MDGRTDGWTDSPCVLQDFDPFGAAGLLPLNLNHTLLKQGTGTTDHLLPLGCYQRFQLHYFCSIVCGLVSNLSLSSAWGRYLLLLHPLLLLCLLLPDLLYLFFFCVIGQWSVYPSNRPSIRCYVGCYVGPLGLYNQFLLGSH